MAVECESDDLSAVITRAGGSASLFGHSSGATVELEATLGGITVTRLAVHESPYVVDDRPRPRPDPLDRVRDRLADGDRAGAIKCS